MRNEEPVALALVTQAQRDMLGSSLKIVFEIKEGGGDFTELLRALDRIDPSEDNTPNHRG